MVVMSGGGIPDINAVDGAGADRFIGGRYKTDHRLKYDSKFTKLPENVIEVPNPDRLRFEERKKREAMVAELDGGNDEGRRKLNVAGEEDGHNHDNDIPVRTRLKTTPRHEIVTKGINKTQLMFEALEVIRHLPPDDPDGPGKNSYLYMFHCFSTVIIVKQISFINLFDPRSLLNRMDLGFSKI